MDKKSFSQKTILDQTGNHRGKFCHRRCAWAITRNYEWKNFCYRKRNSLSCNLRL